jgi:hypothetical protein
MTDVVYHFTCTARLPWIIATKELRPGRNQVGNYPVDFLWATTRDQGDRTAAAMKTYRKGQLPLVRLTLPAGDFEAWPAILARFPQWKPEHIEKLQNAARNLGETNFSCWRARAEPLPLSRVIKSEAKTYTGSWKPIELDSLPGPDPAMRAVVFDDHFYFSTQRAEPGVATQYYTSKISLTELLSEYAA